MNNDFEELAKLNKKLKQLKTVTKYGMTIVCFVMTLHCGLLYTGHDSLFIHAIFVSFVLAVGLWLSCVFQLCWVHKLGVIYSMSVIACVVMRRHCIFEELGLCVQCARFIMMCIGIVITTLTIWRGTRCKTSE